MVILIVGMLLCLLLAVAVVGLVAIPARREGRDLLTPKGEEVVSRVRERTGSAMDAARDKVAEVTTSKDEVTTSKDQLTTSKDQVTSSKDE